MPSTNGRGPKRAKHWNRSFSRACIREYVYRPHTFKEVSAVVTPEVAARLDPDKSYGLWWFNRLGHKLRQVSSPLDKEELASCQKPLWLGRHRSGLARYQKKTLEPPNEAVRSSSITLLGAERLRRKGRSCARDTGRYMSCICGVLHADRTYRTAEFLERTSLQLGRDSPAEPQTGPNDRPRTLSVLSHSRRNTRPFADCAAGIGYPA
jgi:hypothetical protein